LRGILTLLFAISCCSTLANADMVAIGELTFDANTPSALATFDITNLTGLDAFPPDFPITTPLSIGVTGLVANLQSGGTITLKGSDFSVADAFGDINCTLAGDAASGRCDFAAYQVTSATLTGTVSPATGLAGLPAGDTVIARTFSTTIVPNVGCGPSGGVAATLTAGCDIAVIDATASATAVPEPRSLPIVGGLLVACFVSYKLKWLRSFPFARLFCVALAAVFSLLLPPAGWGQTLTASANPASGGAGVNDSYLTGSGFPAGAITVAAVHFGTSCAAPAIASGPVIQVTTQGVLRRFEFLIPASLSPGNYQVWLSGTAGTTAFNTLNTRSCSTIKVTASVTGTASLGAAITNANVTLVDAHGTTVTGTTASDGVFALNSAGLMPPYIVRVVTTTASGRFPAGTTLYSVSADSNASTRINVHVLSDLILRSFYSAQGIDPDTAFTNPIGSNAAPMPAAVQGLAALVIPAVQLWLNQAGVTATPGPPSNGSINLISSPLTAYPAGVTPTAGLDAVLHLITSETIDPGNVTGVTITNGTLTETITPVYSAGDLTLNTTTNNTATGASTSESFTGLVITGANQAAVSAIDAALATFQNIVNTRGSALTGSDLLSLYAPDYLNDGVDAAADANSFAQRVAGVTINSIQVQSLKSLDTTTNVADVIAAFTVSQSGQNQSGTTEFIFKDEGGTWLLYGDQLIGSVSASAESRTSQGAPSLGQGATVLSSGALWQTDIGAFVNTPTSFGTSNVTVSGGGNIWQGGLPFSTLFHGGTLIQNGQNLDQFFGLSQNLGANVLKLVNKPFTFNLTTSSVGNPQYTVLSNPAATTEAIQFSGISNTKGSGPLSSVLGKTVSYNWSLPTTYSIGQVSLFAEIYDGPNNNPSTLGCDISSSDLIGVGSTSASISIPANMSACGLSSSDTIKQVDIFLEVSGTNGEENIVLLTYPY
jgi:hypothetical protein